MRLFKECDEEMINYWDQHKMKVQRAQSSQTAVKPLFQNAVERKKSIEQRNNEYGMKVKAELLKKHAGRELLVYRQVQDKQEDIHDVHNEVIERNLEKHDEIMTTRHNKFINSIGTHFDASEGLLKKNQKQQQKKIKDKVYDSLLHRETIKDNFKERTRNKSAAMADCACKRINNVEEGFTKSVVMM